MKKPTLSGNRVRALGNPLLLPLGSRTVVFTPGGKRSKPLKVNITKGDVARLTHVPSKQSRIRCPLPDVE